MKSNSLVLVLVLAMLSVCAVTDADSLEKKPNDWLLGAKSDAERFESLQTYLRGFDQPMWEVGERFRIIHDALSRNNFELAAYHWEKIRVTIKNGYMKRPARQANSDAILLNSTWGEVNEAFGANNAQQAWAGFEKAKNACMACHVAESVPFMNRQALFELAKPD
ncbi:hypothetical protein NP590_02440 [Methylomonas sp. SURF-2]|uniref:Cytochrome P460 n=1 Tax=Methylomonas subterranea TaxID=2952225 RepID=A0ABT1TBW3_9GAMM|nr:hypothetical protein [Methylomonas sp. SURF-2]MCQ8102952.1 hypothetical protein [Methylomonas sp. SURF-2]